MKKNIIIAALAAASILLVSASCTKQEQPEPQTKTFTAVIEQDVTKTVLTSAYKVEWESGDRININGIEYFASPKSDATQADFTIVSGTAPTPTYSVIYPASLYVTDHFEFPATQTYTTGKFNAPMYAVSDNEELTFKNICGVLCISLKGTDKVKSISVTANEAICGAFSMTDATTVNLTGTGKTVTLDCGTGGVQLSSTATTFYIYLPPRTSYSAGMKIVVTNTDGGTFTKVTTKDATIARKSLYAFSWTPVFLPAATLSGLFTVGVGPDGHSNTLDDVKVQFSSGNLQATYDGSKYTWGFAANQYDIIGNAAGNTTIGTSQTTGAVVDLFGWSATDYSTSAQWGLSTSKLSNMYGTSTKEDNFNDWGNAYNTQEGITIQPWRTLSKNEWNYLMNTRTNASSLYKYGVTITDAGGVSHTNCLVIAPDGYSKPFKTTYTAADWAVAELDGLVCLPAAGYRSGTTVTTGNGHYWTATPCEVIDSFAAYSLYFNNESSSITYRERYMGRSVRLVRNSK